MAIAKNFFAIEGTDGSGKATQTELLWNRLMRESHTSMMISLPQYGRGSAFLVEAYKAGKFGPMLEVDPRQASLCFLVDRFDANVKVQNFLNRNMIVVADRWTASNAAHQAAKLFDQLDHFDYNRGGRFVAWLFRTEHEDFSILEPELYIILDVLPEISMAMKRQEVSKSQEQLDGHEESFDYQRRVRHIYLWLAKTFPKRYKVVQCLDIDNKMLPEIEIHNKIWSIIEPIIKDREFSPAILAPSIRNK